MDLKGSQTYLSTGHLLDKGLLPESWGLQVTPRRVRGGVYEGGWGCPKEGHRDGEWWGRVDEG